MRNVEKTAIYAVGRGEEATTLRFVNCFAKVRGGRVAVESCQKNRSFRFTLEITAIFAVGRIAEVTTVVGLPSKFCQTVLRVGVSRIVLQSGCRRNFVKRFRFARKN